MVVDGGPDFGDGGGDIAFRVAALYPPLEVAPELLANAGRQALDGPLPAGHAVPTAAAPGGSRFTWPAWLAAHRSEPS